MTPKLKHVSHCLPILLGVQLGDIVDVGNIWQIFDHPIEKCSQLYTNIVDK
jgi:hypothetical protein